MSLFKPHSDKQQRAILSKKRITLLGTGIQWGKTLTGAWWLRTQLHKHTQSDDAFIVTAPYYKILQQSTLPTFLKVMEGWGEYNVANSEFRMYNGGKVYFRTNTEPDSIVGITNVRAIWGDEAGKYTLYFWENIQGRASFKQAPIMLTTSPYSLNWVYKELIRPNKKQEREDLLLIQARSNENPHFPDVEYQYRKRIMDVRRFNMMYGGEWDKMEGLVYDCWKDDDNLIDPFKLPMGTRYIGGIDWGYTDPFVIKIRAITPDNRHYGVSEYYKTNTTITDQIEACKHKMKVFGVKMFYADPSQPGSIEEMNRNGVPCAPANNDIRKGIDIHYELIKTKRYKEFRNMCPHSQDEREQYHYPDPKDLKPDQDAKEALPVDQHNHTMDVDRYLSVMTYLGKTRVIPMTNDRTKKLSDMTQTERLEYLKKRKDKKTSYEEWS